MAVKLQCEICGGKLVGKPGGIFECDSCGTEYSTEWAKAKIQEIKGTVKVEGTVEVTGTVKVEGGPSKESLLQRGMMALEDQEWEKARTIFEQALNHDAECAEAFLGLAMAEAKSSNRKAYTRAYTAPHSRLRSSKNAARAKRFGSRELVDWFAKLDQIGAEKDASFQHAEEAKKLAQSKAREDSQLAREKAILEAQRELPAMRKKWESASRRIAAGEGHSVGLRPDGTVVAIGNNNYGQCNTGNWTDICAVAAGANHTVGLKTNGRVVAVGNNAMGQCKVHEWRNIKAIAAGKYVTVGLKEDGSAVCSGTPGLNMKAWTNIAAIAAKGDAVIGLRSDGTVISQNGDTYPRFKDAVAIVAGEKEDYPPKTRIAALTKDGTVLKSDAFGEDVSDWVKIWSIAATDYMVVGLTMNKTVVTNGNKLMAQLVSTMKNWTDIVAVSGGKNHVIGLKSDGTVVAAGNNLYHQTEVNGWRLTEPGTDRKTENKASNNIEQNADKHKEKTEKLNQEKAILRAELSSLKGLFSGKRRKEIEARLAAIEAELEKLG